MGRKNLLTLSAAGGILSLIGVGIGLDSGAVPLASLAVMTFIASFAIGIGPIPFVMIPEVSPHHVRPRFVSPSPCTYRRVSIGRLRVVFCWAVPEL